MKLKISLGLAVAVGLAALVASAVAQQQTGGRPQETPGSSSGADKPVAEEPTVGYRAVVTDGSQPQYVTSQVEKSPYHSRPVQTGPGGGGFWTPHANYTVNWTWSNEEANLARSADQLAQSLGKAKSDSERDKLKSQLSEVLEKQFDLRQRRHNDQIAELEAQVKKLKDLVQKRQENRREIVSKRLDMILSDAQGLGW